MKRKYLRLSLLPFAISIVCFTIYIFYIIYIKLNKNIIVTNTMITTLKVILIIALISLFIGLFIVLIRKIRGLQTEEKVIVNKTVVTMEKTKPEVIVHEDSENIIINNRVKETKNEVISEMKKEEKIVINEETTKKEKVIVDKGIKKEEKIIVQEELEKEEKNLYVSCPECGVLISENAALCPHCGILFDKEVIRVLKKYDRQKADEKRSYGIVSALINIIIIALFVIFIILVVNALLDTYNKNNDNMNKYKTEEKQ